MSIIWKSTYTTSAPVSSTRSLPTDEVPVAVDAPGGEGELLLPQTLLYFVFCTNHPPLFLRQLWQTKVCAIDLMRCRSLCLRFAIHSCKNWPDLMWIWKFHICDQEYCSFRSFLPFWKQCIVKVGSYHITGPAPPPLVLWLLHWHCIFILLYHITTPPGTVVATQVYTLLHIATKCYTSTVSGGEWRWRNLYWV